MKSIGILVAIGSAALATAAGNPDPMQGWNFRFKGFVIGAWWGPGETDAEMEAYKDAGFNVAMIGRYMAVNDQGVPTYDRRFGKAEMLRKQLDLCRRHGLWAMLDTYTPNNRPWGGQMGAVDGHPSHHAASVIELKWLCGQLADHAALLGFLLGDDKSALNKRMIECTRFLHDRHPDSMPWICQNRPNPKSLAHHGNPIFNPQIYPTLYRRRETAAQNALSYCAVYAMMRRECRRYGLLMWPMWNAESVTGDSLIRFPIYAAVAYGADGYWSFCYGNRSYVKRGKYRTLKEVMAGTTPMYSVVKRANWRVRAWAPRLVGTEAVGLFANTGAADAEKPGAGKLVAAMSDSVLVGILAKAGQAPMAMVVDARVSRQFGQPVRRTVTVTFNKVVRSITLLATREKGADTTVAANTVNLDLDAGEGHLVILEGGADLRDRLPKPQPLSSHRMTE